MANLLAFGSDVVGCIATEKADEYVEVVADGVKTRSQMLDSLYALIDLSKVNTKSVLSYNGRLFKFTQFYNQQFDFESLQSSQSNINVIRALVKSSGSIYSYVECPIGGTSVYRDYSSTVDTSGNSIVALYY